MNLKKKSTYLHIIIILPSYNNKNIYEIHIIKSFLIYLPRYNNIYVVEKKIGEFERTQDTALKHYTIIIILHYKVVYIIFLYVYFFYKCVLFTA